MIVGGSVLSPLHGVGVESWGVGLDDIACFPTGNHEVVTMMTFGAYQTVLIDVMALSRTATVRTADRCRLGGYG